MTGPGSPDLSSENWRDRLRVSRDLGTGFAAPGGEFTRALFEWSMMPGGDFLKKIITGARMVELGAGMMPHGYALACEGMAKILWRWNHSMRIVRRLLSWASLIQVICANAVFLVKWWGRTCYLTCRGKRMVFFACLPAGLRIAFFLMTPIARKWRGKSKGFWKEIVFLSPPTVTYFPRDYLPGLFHLSAHLLPGWWTGFACMVMQRRLRSGATFCPTPGRPALFVLLLA